MGGVSGAWLFQEDCREKYQQSQISSLLSVMGHRGNGESACYIDKDIVMFYNHFSVNKYDKDVIGPICNKEKGLVCAFAGRLYNFPNIQKELVQKGYHFQYNQQDEVVLRAFEEWGANCIKRFEGMFVFAIYDSKRHKLHLFRDRLGQRELYYSITKEGVFFGSELKAVLCHFKTRPAINLNGIGDILLNTFIYEPLTIYENIFKLEKATYCEISEWDIKKRIYWDIDRLYFESELETDFMKAKSHIRKLVFESVSDCMVKDNENGAFLSGGIDSSIVTGVLSKLSNKKIHTFSIGFKNQQFNESDKFMLVSQYFNTEHHTLEIDYKHIEPYWDKVILNFDEPYGDNSALPEFLCSKMASKYVPCTLGGEGVDEMFAGYQVQVEMNINCFTNSMLHTGKKARSIHDYDNIYLPELFQANKNSDIREMMRNPHMESPMQAYLSSIMYNSDKTLLEATTHHFLAAHHVIELMKVDRACSLGGIETRRPFLSRDIMEYAYRIPSHFKIHGGHRKYIFKEAFKEMLPDKIYYQKKAGFGAPVIEWLRDYRMQELEYLFSREYIEAQGIFNYRPVKERFDLFRAGGDDWRFWLLYVIQKWYNDTYLTWPAQGGYPV